MSSYNAISLYSGQTVPWGGSFSRLHSWVPTLVLFSEVSYMQPFIVCTNVQRYPQTWAVLWCGRISQKRHAKVCPASVGMCSSSSVETCRERGARGNQVFSLMVLRLLPEKFLPTGLFLSSMQYDWIGWYIPWDWAVRTLSGYCDAMGTACEPVTASCFSVQLQFGRKRCLPVFGFGSVPVPIPAPTTIKQTRKSLEEGPPICNPGRSCQGLFQLPGLTTAKFPVCQ